MMQPEDGKNPWQFPCDFPIKIVGKSSGNFESFVYTTIHKHFPDLTEGAIASRQSKDGNYLAITVMVRAQSKEQLDALYVELTSNKEVLFTL